MLEPEERELLEKISKNQDKILNMLTKVMKFLHLIPITEKEEKAFQIQQRKNLATIAKVSSDLDEIENKNNNTNDNNLFGLIEEAGKSDPYEGLLGDEFERS